MERLHAQHESLLSWIDPQLWDQITWIANYLYKKGQLNLLDEFSPLSGSGEDLITSLRRNLHDAHSREVIRGMRGAWHQRKYRERNGKQVSFQLPESIVDELDKIAKDRNQSRTQTLRQVIHDATKQNQRERKKSREKIKKLENNLKKLKKEKLEAESIRNRIINNLSRKLAEEIMRRCYYEDAVGPMEDNDLEEIKGSRYQELVIRRIEEIEKTVPEIRLLRPTVSPIKHYLPIAQEER